MASFEEEIAFSKMNYAGAPLDVIRASTSSMLMDEVKSGKSIDEAIKVVKAYNEGIKPDMMVKWTLTEAHIDFATEHGIKLGRIQLGK